MTKLKNEFNELPYEEVLKIIQQLSSEKELMDKFVVAGGIVPYLVVGKSSDRNHSDIDLLVKQKDMDDIRNFLKKQNLYETKYDSLQYPGVKQDHGVLARIKGLPVEFYPYEQVYEPKNGTPIINARTFSLSDTPGKIQLRENHLEDISEKDFYVKTKLGNGQVIKTISPEAFVIMKLDIGKNHLREKDKMDLLSVLLFKPLDSEKLDKVYRAFNAKGTYRTVVPKDAVKFTLDEIYKLFRIEKEFGREMA